ncbi:hypothetical protein Pelo_15908 [Pelomyxa schiedti]|nr:hypothetical protein Pelo_15908 [Pelomyxa schiedti]
MSSPDSLLVGLASSNTLRVLDLLRSPQPPPITRVHILACCTKHGSKDLLSILLQHLDRPTSPPGPGLPSQLPRQPQRGPHPALSGLPEPPQRPRPPAAGLRRGPGGPQALPLHGAGDPEGVRAAVAGLQLPGARGRPAAGSHNGRDGEEQPGVRGAPLELTPAVSFLCGWHPRAGSKSVLSLCGIPYFIAQEVLTCKFTCSYCGTVVMIAHCAVPWHLNPANRMQALLPFMSCSTACIPG